MASPAPHEAPADAALAPVADAMADAAARYIHHDGREPTRSALTLVSDKPFALVTAKQSTLLRTRKGAYDVETNQPSFGSTVLIHDRDEFFALYDVAAKKRLGRVGGPIVASSTGLRAYVVDDQKQGRGLLFAAAGQFVRPTITLPGNERATEMQLAITNASDVVWLVARGPKGVAYHGAWSNPQVSTVSLFERLSKWPDYLRGETDALVAGGADAACEQTIVHPSPPHCAPAGARTYLGHGRWLDEAEVIDAAGVHTELMPGCPRDHVVIAAFDRHTGAVLSSCPLTEDAQPYELVAPAGTWRWWETGTAQRDATTGDPEVVTPVMTTDAGVTSWLDLESARVFTGPALTPLSQPWMWMPDGGIHHVDARHVIATTTGTAAGADLWHVDLEHGTYDHIGRIDDCPYTLAVTDIDPTGTRVLLDCNATDAEGSRANPPVGAGIGWVEIVDLAGRTRHRALDVLGGKLVPGAAVGSYTTNEGDSRKRPGAIARGLPVPYESRLVLVTPGQ